MNGKVTRAIFDSVGAHCMSPSDDDRYAPSGHRPTDQNIRHQSAGLQKCSMKAGHSLFSLFAHSPAHATRGSRLAARGSRLEYRTRFLAAPPAGILEQKRDCSQSTLNTFSRSGSQSSVTLQWFD